MYEVSAARAGQSDERQFMRAIALACAKRKGNVGVASPGRSPPLIRDATQGAPGAVAHVARDAPTPGAARAAQPAIAGRALAGAIDRDADGAARHDRAGNLIAEIIVGLHYPAADNPRRIAIGRIARAVGGVNGHAPQ